MHVEDRKTAHNILTGILNVKISYRRTVHRWEHNSHMYGFDSTVLCINISNNMHHTLKILKFSHSQYVFRIIKCMVHIIGHI